METFVCARCHRQLPAQRRAWGNPNLCGDCEYQVEKRSALWMAVITMALIVGLVVIFLVNLRGW